MTELAAAARFELAERHRLYPEHVRAGKVAADWAERDTCVWHAIAATLGDGRQDTALLRDEFTATWSDVRRSLNQARDSRDKACAAKPEDPARIARRDAMHAIVTRLGPVADQFIRINEDRRASATPLLLAA